MPISAPSWTDFLICPICTHEFELNYRAPITLACGHTICKNCLATLHRKQCPFDQANITKDIDNLPINYALLQLVPSLTTSSSNNNNNNNSTIEYEILPSIIQSLSSQDLQHYKSATRCIEDLALYLKPSGNISALLSRPMQRKLVTLINCQLIEDEGRMRSLRAARSLGERTITELILQHQNPLLLSTHLWAAVRARGCQFLGPAMQEEVLKLVLLALEDGSSLSRKVLVMYVVSQLVTTFPQASKTSIGHVVQLLYRASCFKVSKRESDSSLMTLKEEFRTYEALRREHDTQIVQIATEAGLRIAPDQWSALLYGDNNHKSHMQSIIDKQQNPSSFALSVHELLLALQRTGDPANLSRLRTHMDTLANIDSTTEPSVIPTWMECAGALDSVKQVVNGLIDFIQHHGNRKTQENSYLQNTSRYKVSFCRELQNHGSCIRGQNCNFAHSDEELERYRAKYKKSAMRNPAITANTSSSNSSINPTTMKESNNYNNGPNQKVNMNHHSTFAKNNNNLTNNNHHHNNNSNNNNTNNNHETNSSTRYSNKSMSYRSDYSPMHPMTSNRSQYSSHHHLKPSNIYGSSSSTSTPNLTMPLSPNQHKIHGGHANGPRFTYNNGHSPTGFSNSNNNSYMDVSGGKYMPHHRPPLSAPPVQQNFPGKSKQLSPYHQGPPPPVTFSSPTHYGPMKTPTNGNTSQSGYYPPTHFFGNHYNNNNSNNTSGSSNDECNMSTSSSSGNTSFGENKYLSWNHNENSKPKSPNNNHLMPKSPTSQQHQFSKTPASPINRFDVSPGHYAYHQKQQTKNVNSNINNNSNMNIAQQPQNYQVYHQAKVSSSGGSDEMDGMSSNSVWNYQQFNRDGIMKNNPEYNSYNSPPSNNNEATMIILNIKEKFIRSDSILTSNTDDTYDSLSANGKYGAIGLKNIVHDIGGANQWSGLQQTAVMKSQGEVQRDVDAKRTEFCDSSQQRNSRDFLNISGGDVNISASTSNTSNDFWSNDSLQNWNGNESNRRNNIDVDTLDNEMWRLKVWDFIDE